MCYDIVNMFGGNEPKVPQISAEEVKQMLDENQDIFLLDVRTPEEHSKSHIKGSINLPIDMISERIYSFIPDHKQQVVVYCLSSSRSIFAVDAMIKMGYTNVYNMTSGLLAWRSHKFALVS